MSSYKNKKRASSKKKYPTDLTSQQWRIIRPLLPLKQSRGRPRQVDERQIINAIIYLNKTGYQWRLLPKDFPAWESAYYYFAKWKKDNTWKKIHDTLRNKVREEVKKK